MTMQMCKEPVYKIENGRTASKSVTVDEDVWHWLEKEAETHNLTYCLGHTLDGVFWGQVDGGGKFHVAITDGNSFEAFDQTTFFDLLCELRLFGKTAELHLWQQNGNWQARLIKDGVGGDCEYVDELQMVWGTQIEATNGQFTLVSDGVQELYHAVPLLPNQIPIAKNGKHRPLRLQVRHYLADDETGQVRIAYSRLVALTAVAQEKTDGS